MNANTVYASQPAGRGFVIDYRRHMAIIAAIFTDSGETMIGEACYIVDESDAAACEFGIAVTDDWQGKGLARSLLARLANHAASSGLHRIGGDTIPSNRVMIALAKRTGFTIAQKLQDARLMHLAKDLLTNDQHTMPTDRHSASV